MNKNVKGAITVIVVAAIAYGVYKIAFKSKIATARYLVKTGKHENVATLMLLDEAYLKEWAKAVKRGEETFDYKDKKYNTAGGKAV